MILLEFYCPHGLADGNYCIWIREKTLEFSATVLPAPSPYPQKYPLSTFILGSFFKTYQNLTERVW